MCKRYTLFSRSKNCPFFSDAFSRDAFKMWTIISLIYLLYNLVQSILIYNYNFQKLGHMTQCFSGDTDSQARNFVHICYRNKLE